MCYGIHGPGMCGGSDILTQPGGFRAVTGGPSIFGCGYGAPVSYGCYNHGWGYNDHCPVSREKTAIKTGAVLGTTVGVVAGTSAAKALSGIGLAVGGPLGGLLGGVAGFAIGAFAGKYFART